MLTCDVTDDASVQKMVDEVLSRAGRIDLLVNNADYWLAHFLSSLRRCEWRRRIYGCRHQTGSPSCFRRLLSNADAGTKRRRKLTWRAILPAA